MNFYYIFVPVNQQENLTYLAPLCQTIPLAPECVILSGSTKDGNVYRNTLKEFLQRSTR